MYEHALEAGRRSDGRGAWVRSEEREDPRRPLVPCRELDGHGLAHQAEPAPADRRTDRDEAHVAGVRAGGNEHPNEDGDQVGCGPVGTLGRVASATATAVRSEGKPTLVTGPVSTANVLAMLDRQRFRCNLTGRPLTPDTAALDHIVPMRCGGEHVIENTQVLHKDVNRAKNSMANDEFIALCREVVRWTASRT